jgi:hypothetical protein
MQLKMVESPIDAHYFLSSIATWRTTGPTTTMLEVLQSMLKEGYPVAVWYVPAKYSASYDIKNYAPQVEGAVWLGNFTKR